MSTEQKIYEVENALMNTYKTRLRLFRSMCESPIEELFLMNFIFYYESLFLNLVTLKFEYDIPEYHDSIGLVFPKKFAGLDSIPDALSYPYGVAIDKGNFKALLIPQYEVTLGQIRYRVDFLLKIVRFDASEKKVCIECDGHEFHQKTKEQVSKDNARDRNLMTNGYVVFRYSGSEIYTQRNTAYFPELMKQIEKLAVYDLVERERKEMEEFIQQYVKEKGLDQSFIEILKKDYGIFDEF